MPDPRSVHAGARDPGCNLTFPAALGQTQPTPAQSPGRGGLLERVKEDQWAALHVYSPALFFPLQPRSQTAVPGPLADLPDLEMTASVSLSVTLR